MKDKNESPITNHQSPTQIKKPNLFNYISAIIRAFGFVVFALIFAVAMIPVRGGSRFGVRALSFFMKGLIWFSGSKIVVHGKISDARPLLIVANHISVFEIGAGPAVFGNSFFSKKEMRSWPLIGWISAKFGVQFIDRNPATALQGLKQIRDEMARVSWPIIIFPEGTTTNGSHVLPFKSAMFNFMEISCDIEGQHMGGCTVQPIVWVFRKRDGSKLSDEDLAYNFAWFDSRKQKEGPLNPPSMPDGRGLIAQVLHVFAVGGMLIEAHVLPVPNLQGICDRKELAASLGKIVSDEYMRLK